jgi:diguanylate cyclase (GGDEF)-like protein
MERTFMNRLLPASPDGTAVAKPEISAADCDTLFAAVVARLRLVAEDPQATSPRRLRLCLWECSEALQQLHRAMAVDVDRLEREVVETRGALKQARHDLAGTQDDERRERHRALHDDLTALPNRAHFRARLDQALERAPQRRPTLAVLYVDLDGFKPINDRHGHSTGDALLRIVATRLQRAVRSEDLVCRLGGDEFACLLSQEMDREKLGELACKLFDVVSAPLKVGPLELCVRPSIGIAVCPEDGHTTAMLLECADAAMYSAKRQQTGYAFFNQRTATQ